MAQSNKPVPSAEQQRIIDADADANVIVVAGAGSGKTFTMTERVIHLIHEGVPPEHILGLTFTNKAASELLSRVSKAVLDDARERAKEGGAHPARLAFMKPDVRTYDAFFQSIVRQYGLLVGFDPQTQPLSAAGARQIIASVVGRHVDEIVQLPVDMGSFGTVVDAVGALANNIANSMIGNGCLTVADAIERITQWDATFRTQILDLLQTDESGLLTGPLADRQRGATPKAVKSVLKARKKVEKKGGEYVETPGDKDAVSEAMHADAELAARDLYLVAMKRDVLLGLVREFDEEKRRRHMAEYSDFVIAAYQLVERFPSIGAHYRRQFTHVLLDEFQDTSTTQSALLAALFHVDEPHGADRSAAVSAVGDPFQSIYAWRGASPGAFRMFINDFHMPAATEPLSMTCTRRNSRVVLQGANNLTKVLRRVEQRPSGANAQEVPVQPLRNVDDGSIEVDEGTLAVLGLQTRGQEVDAVARFVKQSVEQYGEACNPGDSPVSVLFRSKKAMALYEDQLSQVTLRNGRPLRVRAVGLSAMLDRPEVQDVLALLKVVGDHTDANALMRLLATPRYALGALDLKRLARRATDLNTEYRFRTLVEAGLAPAGTPKREWGALVRQYARNAPNMVYLIDMLLRDDVAAQLEAAGLSDEGRAGVMQAVEAMHRVQDEMYQPLAQVIHTAVEALNLDVDLMLASSLRTGEAPAPRDAVRAAIDALLETVNTYTSEIAQQQRPTLRGFLAYLDMANGNDMPEAAADLGDEPADVVLMTVHQSKGLEWDAVAIVGMQQGAFPSNQGDALRVKALEDRGSKLDWEPPLYEETAKSWLESPEAVPVPIRVDAAILPKFPMIPDAGESDASSLQESAVRALRDIDSVESLENDAYGELRALLRDNGVLLDELGEPDAWDLSQKEERGRALHADERRLMYVALTRAKHDALVTYSVGATTSRVPEDNAKESGTPSVFWRELRDSMSRDDSFSQRVELTAFDDQPTAPARPAAAAAGNTAVIYDDLESTQPRSLHERGAKKPEGIIVGKRAKQFATLLVDEPYEEPMEPIDTEQHLPWPSRLSEEMHRTLRKGATQVVQRMSQNNPTNMPGETAKGDGRSLLERARQLIDNRATLIREGMTADEIEKAVRMRGQRVLAAKDKLTATGLQRNAEAGENATDFALEIIRPVPQVSTPQAQAGTRFHAWAQRYLEAGVNPEYGISQEAMAHEVAHEAEAVEQTEREGRPVPREQRDLLTWKQRFLESAWSAREPAAVEQTVSTFVSGIGKRVDAKLDAVFYGGLGDGMSGASGDARYTIVDWKTGSRPRNAQQRAGKLAQLDMYRYFWALQKRIPMSQIDAALYYVSEKDPAKALVVAPQRSEAEVLAEMRAGVPEPDDND
ncbi:ATP-dependent DNA helicase [Bifidobacterium animalis subsp. animalis MCC 0483]|uniref:DNA 3'-5' helicase n=1 Tax=Bifidobacterium animalis subsp. animalis MCC 0483 TaxID=1365955 RepID=A0AB34T8R2_9BIFI|nr:ATP-dependent DNA helicase [Bifidobacterium animalis]KOA49219.1 ATP-dependent DNA helicase [Bifidobacterium animalis subsp. animalis MCC 0483]KOA54177.1 ATP-dependent DNA helicase [Bifidobacterium animalis subsp. animalis ATCC 27672]KOA58843.1 ATP-dependent DNA helicase [Bifidobacterium animalis subsp. animalis MCC 0499]